MFRTPTRSDSYARCGNKRLPLLCTGIQRRNFSPFHAAVDSDNEFHVSEFREVKLILLSSTFSFNLSFATPATFATFVVVKISSSYVCTPVAEILMYKYVVAVITALQHGLVIEEAPTREEEGGG